MRLNLLTKVWFWCLAAAGLVLGLMVFDSLEQLEQSRRPALCEPPPVYVEALPVSTGPISRWPFQTRAGRRFAWL